MKKMIKITLIFIFVPFFVYAEQLATPLNATIVIDLTHKMHNDMPFWPGGVPFNKEQLVGYDQGYLLHKFTMGENTGTHIDAPAHFIEGNLAIDEIPPEKLIVPIVAIDIREKVASNDDYQLTADDVITWESENGQIPASSLVVLNSGWHKRFGDPEQYINMDAQNVMHFPG